MRTRNSFEWNKNYPFTDISGGKGGGREGGRERRKGIERKNPESELAGWLSVLAHTRVEKLCFQHQFTPTFSRRARTRWIKLGILRKETRPHIRRIVIRPLHSLVAVAAFLSLALSVSSSLLASLSFSRPPGFLVSSFAKRPLCRSYFALPWGLPGLPGAEEGKGRHRGGKREGTEGKKETEAESYARVVEKISFSPKRFPTVPFRGMRGRKRE